MKQKVYVITNHANGKKYVGCSQNVAYRFKQHMSGLRHHRHNNKNLQKDYDEYGEEQFSYEVVDEKHEPFHQTEERSWMIKLQTYDERFGYNYKDPMMSVIRKEKGLSGMKAHNPSGWCGEWWKTKKN